VRAGGDSIASRSRAEAAPWKDASGKSRNNMAAHGLG
jgi:hypothetical protein